MRPSAKQQLIEQLNRAFEEKIQTKQKAKYAKYVRELTEKLVDKRPKNRIEMQKIIRAQKLDTKTATRMFTVLGSVSASIMNPPKNLQEKQKLEPLQQIMRAYSVTSPRTFADNVYNMTTGRNMSKKNEQFRPALLSYYSGFTETIETADQQYQRALQRSQLESKSAIFEDFEDMRRERIPVTKQKTLLLEKYANPIRVQRLLETELHEQAERTKLEQSKFMQYTHKQWNTQRDERVRNTKFHQIVDKQRVPIDSNFKGGGEEADYPGDIGLPPGERINCRCYVTYFNGPDERIKRTPVTVPATNAPEPKEARVNNDFYTERDNSRIYDKNTGKVIIDKNDIDLRKLDARMVGGKMEVVYEHGINLDPREQKDGVFKGKVTESHVPPEWLDDIFAKKRQEAQNLAPANADPEIIQKYKNEYDSLDIEAQTETERTELIDAGRKINDYEFKTLPKMIQEMNYDQPPKIIDTKTMTDKLINEKGTLVVRGYSATNQDAVNLYRRQMESGDFYIQNSGGAAWGRGMYSAIAMTQKDTTDWNEKGLQVAKEYSGTVFATPEQKTGHIDVMYLPPNFKILTMKQLKEIESQRVIENLIKDKDEEAIKLGQAMLRENEIEAETELLSRNVGKNRKKLDALFDEKFQVTKTRKDASENAKKRLRLYELKYKSLDASITALQEGYDGYTDIDDEYVIILNRSKVQLLDNFGEDRKETAKRAEKLLTIVGVERENRAE